MRTVWVCSAPHHLPQTPPLLLPVSESRRFKHSEERQRDATSSERKDRLLDKLSTRSPQTINCMSPHTHNWTSNIHQLKSKYSVVTTFCSLSLDSHFWLYWHQSIVDSEVNTPRSLYFRSYYQIIPFNSANQHSEKWKNSCVSCVKKYLRGQTVFIDIKKCTDVESDSQFSPEAQQIHTHLINLATDGSCETFCWLWELYSSNFSNPRNTAESTLQSWTWGQGPCSLQVFGQRVAYFFCNHS